MDLKKYGGFTPQDIQSCYAVLHHMKKKGVVYVDDAILQIEKYTDSFMHQRQKEYRKRKFGKHKVKIPAITCSSCGGPVYLNSVNVNAATLTGDDSKTAIMCYNTRGCGQVDYSSKAPNEFKLKWVVTRYDRARGQVFKDVD